MATFSDWGEVGSPTVTVETTIVWQGVSSAKVVAGGSIGQLTQILTDNPDGNIDNYIGKSVQLRGRLWASVANAGRLRIDWDGGTTITSSAFHPGTDQWLEVILDTNVPTGATELKLVLETAANQTVYFDSVWLAIDNVAKYTIPALFISGPWRVTEQESKNRPRGDYNSINPNATPTRGMNLLLEGAGYLSATTTDTDTMEIQGGRVDLLVARAAQELYDKLASKAIGQERNDYRQESLVWERKIKDDFLKREGVRMTRRSTERPRAWELQEDNQGRYIQFRNTRQ